jgi:RNA recognition motif-containing protein
MANSTDKDKKLSLYISQLPFGITKDQIADHFKGKGIVFDTKDGVRCVEKKEKNGKPSLVAFIDVGNMASFKNGLKLHRSRIDGRQINVRPTVKPEELERIVEQKKKKVEAVVKVLEALNPKLTEEVRAAYPSKAFDKNVLATMAQGRQKDSSSKKRGHDDEDYDQKKKVKNTPEMLDVLESREKWSKSKKTRERLRLKKLAKSSEKAASK